MFTGIVEAFATVESIEEKGSSLSITLSHPELFQTESLGASYAINGVCLTQAKWSVGTSTFDVIEETISKTNLGYLKVGERVNVECPMRIGSTLDGHFVQGHVDGVGTIQRIEEGHKEIQVKVPKEMQKYLIYKGSICMDGISLTLASVEWDGFTVALIPHTLEKTNLSEKKVGDFVNLEIDMFGKYIHKYLQEYLPEMEKAYDV